MAVSNHPGVSRGVSSAQPSQKTFCFSGRRPLEPGFSSSSPSRMEIHRQRPPTFPSKSGGKEAGRQGCFQRALQAARRCQVAFGSSLLGERSQTGRSSRSQASGGWCLVANPPASPEREGAARAHPRAPQQAGKTPARLPGRRKEGRKGRYPKAKAAGLEGGLQEGTAGRGMPLRARGEGEEGPETRRPAAEGPRKGWPARPPFFPHGRQTSRAAPLSTCSFVQREPCRRGRGSPLLRAGVSQARPLVPPRSPQPLTTPWFPLGTSRAATPSLATLAGWAGWPAAAAAAAASPQPLASSGSVAIRSRNPALSPSAERRRLLLSVRQSRRRGAHSAPTPSPKVRWGLRLTPPPATLNAAPGLPRARSSPRLARGGQAGGRARFPQPASGFGARHAAVAQLFVPPLLPLLRSLVAGVGWSEQSDPPPNPTKVKRKRRSSQRSPCCPSPLPRRQNSNVT